ncbi:hypothetical protein Tco_0898984, partial [Tanacetum coccineum]
HLDYINHLKESVETVREIVEEARIVKPLDSTLNYACQYTKRSQELLEYVVGTCPKNFTTIDNKAASTSLNRKKQGTFNDRSGTSTNNTQKHEVHQKVQQTNVPVIHSTGVNTSTHASGSKLRSNTKQNRILPAKSVNNKKVEENPRTNKSVWTKVNRVDFSISSKRVVINSNSESMYKTCNKCLNSVSHGMCVVNILNSVNVTPTVRIVLNKDKQIWKPKGKMWYRSCLVGTGLRLIQNMKNANIRIFIRYAPSRKGYRIYNKRTRRLMETIHVTFDEMHQTRAPVRMSSGPEPVIMTPG